MPEEKKAAAEARAKLASDATSVSLAAAIHVQKLFRGFRDRHEYRRQCLLEAWDELERKEESELHYSSKELGMMTEMYKKLSKSALKENGPEGKRRPSVVFNRNRGSNKDSEFIPSLSWLATFMDKCSKDLAEGKAPMRADKLNSLLEKTQKELKKSPNVVDIELKGDVTLMIVGDLHGQVADLLHILKTHDLPTKNKWFLFNGDFVDRGRFAVEITIILFTLKLLYPEYVFLNRGNHEADDINARDGFQDECSGKYNREMYQQYNETFATLPLVHIINKKAMVVHGGLCWDAGVTLDKIQKIDRFCLHPVWESVMEDLLWSDPGGPKHCGASQNDRGCGCIFGEDIVDEFFEDNPPLKLVIRSHEKKDRGYQEHFHGKLVTIFSASNYCGDNGNDGAVMEIFPSLDYKIHTFYATPAREEDTKFVDRYCTLSASVAAKLIHRIAENRLQLLEYFRKCSGSGTKVEAEYKNATITRVDWSNGLKEVLGLKIRFLFLQNLLGVPPLGVDGQKKGKFNYVQWLSKFAPSNTKLQSLGKANTEKVQIQETIEKISNVLLKHRVAVKSMFQFFDTNGDGKVCPQELADGLMVISKVYDESFSEHEVKSLVEELDKNGDSEIEYAEFLATFTVSNPELAKALKTVPVENIMRGAKLSQQLQVNDFL